MSYRNISRLVGSSRIVKCKTSAGSTRVQNTVLCRNYAMHTKEKKEQFFDGMHPVNFDPCHY